MSNTFDITQNPDGSITLKNKHSNLSENILNTLPQNQQFQQEIDKKIAEVEKFLKNEIADARLHILGTEKNVSQDIRAFKSVMSDLAREVSKIAQNQQVKTIVVDKNNVTQYEAPETSHAMLPKVLARVAAGCPVLLVGPTQCGKTTLAKQVSEALKLPFAANSMSSGTKESDLTGWLLPTRDNGAFDYHPAPFVTTVENGGVFLADEIDAADPNFLLILNMLVANGEMFIPHRLTKPQLKKHKDFHLIATANTWGNGTSFEYMGRNVLDASTLARFVKIAIDYDETMEINLYDTSCVVAAHAIRRNIRKHKLPQVMTTNTIKQWSQCLANNISLSECIDDYFLGWSQEEIKLATQENVKDNEEIEAIIKRVKSIKPVSVPQTKSNEAVDSIFESIQ
jgi:cobaltochelatase CobS